MNKYTIEGDLRRFNTMAIKRLVDIQARTGRTGGLFALCSGGPQRAARAVGKARG